MNHDELTRAAARVNPVPPDAFAGFADSVEGRRVLEAVLATSVPGTEPHERARWGRRARWGGRVVLAAVAACVVVAVVTFIPWDRTEPHDGPRERWAPALLRMAERAPRLLVGADGWEVVGADEFEGGSGEIYFDNGRSCQDAGAAPGCYWLSLNWYPVESYDSYLEDRRREADGTSRMRIGDHEAVVFRHEGGALGTTFYAMWEDDEHWLELRSDVIPTEEEFTALARSLYEVDPATWLAALPPSVVEPAERGDEIDRIVSDIPIPSNVDLDPLRDDARVREDIRYEVTTVIVCGWIQQWVDATRSGDDAAAREAVEALAGSRGWAVFSHPGQYESYVFELADAMQAGKPVNAYERLFECEDG